MSFDYPRERWKIEKDVFLCYDVTARGDLAVRFVRLKNAEVMVILFQEPDKPFQTGFVREKIAPEQFATRVINGRPLIELVRGKGLS